MPHPPNSLDVWSVKGRFQQLVYSPKGAIEGLLINTEGVPTQFVCDPHDVALGDLLASLRHGQTLVLEGTEPGPSPEGEPRHSVYALERLAKVNGKAPAARPAAAATTGTVVRLNYARHGAANGVVLDNGDFVHTKPEGFERFRLELGDTVRAEGPARPLADGSGRVIEGQRINGKAAPPSH